jgi:hypothetical protein
MEHGWEFEGLFWLQALNVVVCGYAGGGCGNWQMVGF